MIKIQSSPAVPVLLTLLLVLTIQHGVGEININYSGTIQTEGRYQGIVVNKSNRPIEVEISTYYRGKQERKTRVLYPGEHYRVSLRGARYQFDFYDPYWGDKKGSRSLSIDRNKVFHERGTYYWNIEYLGTWKVRGRS